MVSHWQSPTSMLPFVGICRYASSFRYILQANEVTEKTSARTGAAGRALRPCDLDAEGIPREYLNRLVEERLSTRTI